MRRVNPYGHNVCTSRRAKFYVATRRIGFSPLRRFVAPSLPRTLSTETLATKATYSSQRTKLGFGIVGRPVCPVLETLAADIHSHYLLEVLLGFFPVRQYKWLPNKC